METLRTSRPNAETKAPAENLYPQKEQHQLDNTRRQTDFLSPRVSIKKTLLIALLLLTAALSFAEIYTIGSDYTYNTNIPLNTMMAYSWSKSLISAADIQTAGLNGVAAITAIGFYPAGESPIKTFTNQEIYLRNTDLAVQNNSCPNTEDYNLVYSGDVTFQGSDWNTCTFSIPFIWDGLSNIEIVWLNNHGVSYTGSFFFRNDYVSDYATAHKFSSTAFPTGNGSLDYIRPYMQIHALQSPSPQLYLYPTALDFGEIPLGEAAEPLTIQAFNCGQETLNLSEANISISPANADLFLFDASNLPAALEIGESVQIPVSAATGTLGTFSSTLTITYADVSHDVSLSSSIIPAGIVEIGSGTNHQPQPFDMSWGYGRSAAIYTMEDIGTVGMIESIGWYCSQPYNQTAPYKIYVGPTLFNEIPSGETDGYFANVTQGLTLVSQGSYAFNYIGWHIFDLDTPIAYSGENLLVAVETNHGGSGAYNYPYFRYTPSNTNSHCYWRNHIIPPSVTGYLNNNRPNLRLVLGDITINPQLSVSPQSIDFGAVFTGIETGPINLTLSNTGVGVFVLNEEDVSFTGADAAMFRYNENVFPLTIFTDHSVTIPLYVTPSREGNISANFVINFAGEDHIVDLAANAVTHQGTFFAQLGDEPSQNSPTGNPAPYGTHYRSFREQYLIKADELHAQNGGSGIIESIAFNVATLNDVNTMNNYLIRLKHTNQDELDTTFELGDYTEVFHAQTLMPHEGWNTHLFQFPFAWNGISNILVDIGTTISSPASQNASTYCTNLGYCCTLRWQRDHSTSSYATTGELSTNRPNMIFSMQERNFMDIAAASVTGRTFLNVDNSYNFTVRICNLSPLPASGYQVKLVAQLNDNSPIVVGSIAGATLQPLEYADIVFPWIPTSGGDATIYGKVYYDMDEYLDNNDTQALALEIMDEGYQVIQIGEDEDTSPYLFGPMPYGNTGGSFRQQFLYKADEIAELITPPGLISGIAFNVQDFNQLSHMSNYRIRLKHTDQTTLISEVFEAGEYTQVFSTPSLVITNGWNTHMFDRSFVWNGIDNILVDILSDYLHDCPQKNPFVYCSPTSFAGSLRQLDWSEDIEQATSGVPVYSRTNTRFYMEINGMGSLSGTVMEDGYPVPNMLITMEDTAFETTTNQDGIYQFPYIYAGTYTLTASKNCYTSVSHTIVVEEDEHTIQDFIVSGTPEFSLSASRWDFGNAALGDNESTDFRITNTGGGTLTINSIDISGSEAFTFWHTPTLPITLRSDEYITFVVAFAPTITGIFEANVTILDDIYRDLHELALRGRGTNAITLGEPLFLNRVPFDFYRRNTVYQVLFTNDELGGFNGMFTGIRLYNDFSQDLYDKQIKIWMGSTSLSDLSGGWISSDDMSLVFDGVMDFLSYENTIWIYFQNHFLLNENENLVVLFYKPDDVTYSSMDRFKSFPHRENASIKYDGYFDIDPANIPNGTLGSMCPVITFDGMPGSAGQIQGIVHNSAGIPLSDVSITLNEHSVTYYSDEDGMFLINNIWPGEHVLSCSRYDYLDQSMFVIVEEGVISEMDVTLLESPLVSIMGKVVAADTGEEISGAEITLSGCAEYSTITNAVGEFIIDNGVYAQNIYTYHITAVGYTALTGTIELGLQDYNMGTITIYEFAHMPAQVLAELNAYGNSVDISWDAPIPDSDAINENKIASKFAQKTDTSKDRSLLGYKVYRLVIGQELLERYWVLLADEISQTSLTDAAWNDLPCGLYRWAVKAVYSEGVISEATFSNSIEKGNIIGTLSGLVYRNVSEIPVEGVLIKAIRGYDEYVTITAEDGSYVLPLPEGMYRVNASHEEFYPIVEGRIFITPGGNTSLDFCITHVSSEDVVEITTTALHSNYPNPFNPETTISYDLKEPAKVRLQVYNLKGQLVKTLVNAQESAGRHNVVFSATDDRGNKLSSGLYFYRLRAGDYIKTRKMMLIE